MELFILPGTLPLAIIRPKETVMSAFIFLLLCISALLLYLLPDERSIVNED